MEWLFEGLGTLAVGVVLGVAGDRALLSYKEKRVVRQLQKAGDQATQTQIGGDVRPKE
ncbi:MAG: hypothetical protein ACOYXM_05455 [Actinomycetota bacterium]